MCGALGESKDHKVIYLTEKDYENVDHIDGVETRSFKQHRLANSTTHHYLHTTEECILKGQALIKEIDLLLADGFCPELIIFHGGMGYGLFINELLPHAKTIGYFEWWFTSKTSQHLCNSIDYDTRFKNDMRNLVILKELANCTRAVVPTEWQKNQFPNLAEGKLKVIFDGVNEYFFHEDTLRHDADSIKTILIGEELNKPLVIENKDLIVSYATRGMEPLRGFPEFMLLLPELFKEFNNLKVIIGGRDRAAYSYTAPTENGSWKEYMLEKLKGSVDIERIFFTGLMSYENYRSLLRRSDLHVYFTRPYVVSWSLFEAITCRAHMLVNRNGATNGIATDDSVYWTDLDRLEECREIAVNALKLPRQNRKKALLMKDYSLKKSLNEWSLLINEVFQDH
ncbi:hypothetical protein [Prochlorococcus marinus]|uniref:hypothetical protein n=1 Tax=Prochlorococcus marinus TaxID=1219 RepID=UPI001F40F053|nr:hypothetical protein [Prochlorococcus marinus]